jgi:hypothetical protein
MAKPKTDRGPLLPSDIIQMASLELTANGGN